MSLISASEITKSLSALIAGAIDGALPPEEAFAEMPILAPSSVNIE